MASPFVKSNFPRVPGDHYPTIDPHNVWGFLEVFQPKGLSVDVCAPQGSGIVNELIRCGYRAVGAANAFAKKVVAEWIVCNPPYTRPLVDEIITRQLERVQGGEVYGVAMLLKPYFCFAKSRADMFEHPFYNGEIKLRHRPRWAEKKPGDEGPIHHYVWQIWTADNCLKRPAIYFADCVQPVLPSDN